MSNDTYLVISYFTVFLLCAGLGILVYSLLCRSFLGTIQHLRRLSFPAVLRKVFFIGIVFPALMGFFSVSYYSCDRQTYTSITSDLSYLVSANQEQLSASLLHLVVAMLVWCVVVLCVLVVSTREQGEVKSIRDVSRMDP
jgi:hypothetical protein